MSSLDAAMGRLLIGLIRGYQLISRFTPPVCRYSPSCSAYAVRALSVHGALRGGYLAGRRILSCHPWSDGGYDPVPGTPEAREWAREQSDRARERRLAAEAAAAAPPAEDLAAAAPSQAAAPSAFAAPCSPMPSASLSQGTP